MKYQSFKNSKNKLQNSFENQNKLDLINLQDSITNASIIINEFKQNLRVQFINNIYNLETDWTDLTYTSTLKGTQFFRTSFENLPLNVILNIKSDIIHQVGINGLVVDTLPNLYSESGFRKVSFIELTQVEGQEDLYNVVLNNWIYFNNILDSNPLPPYQVKLILQIFIPVEYL